LQFLENELESQKNFNQQIMKQMRKLEYALHQQKKQLEKNAQAQISIKNTQNNTIFGGVAGSVGTQG
jgi:hypothetical protein